MPTGHLLQKHSTLNINTLMGAVCFSAAIQELEADLARYRSTKFCDKKCH